MTSNPDFKIVPLFDVETVGDTDILGHTIAQPLATAELLLLVDTP